MKFRVLFFVGLVSIFFTTACSALTPPTPTSTPAPTETATPVPTNTPEPTRPLATATAANAVPPAISFALNKTQNARSMQFEFESSVTTVQDGQTKKIPGLALQGMDSTLNRNITISGTTSDTNEFITYQVIVLGEAVYIKGISGNGLDPQEWYDLPEAVQAGVRRLPTARGLIASFDPADVSSAQFQAAGSETVDDENCSVWTANNAKYAQTLVGVTADSELGKQLGQVDNAEFKIWTCADGYIHLMTGQVLGHAAAKTQDTTTVTLRFHMNRFEEAFKFQAPANFKPFPGAPQAQPTANATKATGATPTPTRSATPSPTP